MLLKIVIQPSASSWSSLASGARPEARWILEILRGRLVTEQVV